MRQAGKLTRAAGAAALAVLLAACGQTAGITAKPSASVQASAYASPAPPAQTVAPAATSAPPAEISLANLKSVAAGDNYSLAVAADGSLLAWGNYAGAIEGEEYPQGTEQIRVIDKDAASVAAAADFCAEIKADGSLWVWGKNTALFGDAGQPKPVKALDGVAAVSLGGGFVLAVKTDGTLWAWGADDQGQLGDSGKAKFVGKPKQVMQGVKRASAGNAFSLILKKDGTLWGCGNNGEGQLLGFSNRKTPQFKGSNIMVVSQTVPVKLMAGVADVAAGAEHSLALDTSGNLWAFGYNSSGQIGDNWGKNMKLTPYLGVDVSCRIATKVLTDVSSITASASGSGALRKDGTLWLWGGNDNNELGDGGFTTSYVPKKVLGGVASAAQCNTHCLAVKTDGSLWAWGDNRYGQLGTGYCNVEYDYIKVADDVKQVSSSGNATFIVKNDGSLWGAGSNDYGQLPGAKNGGASAPLLLMKDVSQAALGDYTAFCIKKDGALWSWGDNRFGALGNGKLEAGRYSLSSNISDFSNGVVPAGYRKQAITPDALHLPAKVLDGVKQVLAFHIIVLAVRTDNTMWGWGLNEGGVSFPDNTSGDTATPKQRAASVRSILDMDMLAKTDGWLYTWGSMMMGDPLHKLVKSQISGVSSAVGDSGWRMAVKSDGTLWFWGMMRDKKYDKPVKIEDHVKAVTRGGELLVLADDGTLYSVSEYELGTMLDAWDGKSDFHFLGSDAAIKELDGVAQAVSASPAASGGESICSFAVKTDGTLWASGYNKYGQLGDGRAFFTPKQVSK